MGGVGEKIDSARIDLGRSDFGDDRSLHGRLRYDSKLDLRGKIAGSHIPSLGRLGAR